MHLPPSQIPACEAHAIGSSVLFVGDPKAWNSSIVQLLRIGCRVSHAADLLAGSTKVRQQDRRTLVVLCEGSTAEVDSLPTLWQFQAKQATVIATEGTVSHLGGTVSDLIEANATTMWLLLALWLRYPLTCHARYKFARYHMLQHSEARELIAHLTFCCPSSAKAVAKQLCMTSRTVHRSMFSLGMTLHGFCQLLLADVVRTIRDERALKLSALACELGCRDAKGLSRRLRG